MCADATVRYALVYALGKKGSYKTGAEMADKDQLQILTTGAKEWSAWRHMQPRRRIDLRNAKLHGESFKHAAKAKII